MNIIALWDVIQRNMNRKIRKGKQLAAFYSLKLKASGSSQTLISAYQTALRHII